MYFPIGWPKCVNLTLPDKSAYIVHITFDAVKILLAAIGAAFLGIWYANPLVPIVSYRRSAESVNSYGANRFIVWKLDSSQLVVLTTGGVLLLYHIEFVGNGNGIFLQVDSPTCGLKRDSAELFIKENIPQMSLREICCVELNHNITSVCCISLSELLIANDQCELIRVQWSQLQGENHIKIENDMVSTIKLRHIQFYVSQHCKVKHVPPIGEQAFVSVLEYSPFIGGCAAYFNDHRSAFLIASHLKFETAYMHGFWIPEVEDATACSVNHKFRLLAFGRQNSDVSVYGIEDTTGSLEFSHCLSLNSSMMSGSLGAVNELKWSPDGCVIIVAWQNGGLSLWSTFGTLLMSSLNWDYGIGVDLSQNNPLRANKLEWSTEGYQLFVTCQDKEISSERWLANESSSNVLQFTFVKSTLTMNPCMASHSHILLQDDHTLYLNQGDSLKRTYFGDKFVFPNSCGIHSLHGNSGEVIDSSDCMEVKTTVDMSSVLTESKYWTILHLPETYVATNWPIRYSAIDSDGFHLSVAGRTGLAHYSLLTRKWKLFGNESQEKDFVVSGGLMWWKGFIVAGCYSLLEHTDEIRCYPGEYKLDNQFSNRIRVQGPVISLNMFCDQLIALTADGIVSLYTLQKQDSYTVKAVCDYELDVKSICIHPACIVSLTVTNLRNDFNTKNLNMASTSYIDLTNNSNTNTSNAFDTIILNVCGRILMVPKDNKNGTVLNSIMATCLASCVECFWLSNMSQESNSMHDCLWLYSGIHGMRVWLPILPPVNAEIRDTSQRLHTFMSKRIMLSFPMKLYPMVILFDNAIALGVENETTLFTNETNSHFSFPFSLLERKSLVYLHKILRQLIKRNLGYSAWEIAQSCRHLPYFPHSLELLLHEVLEEEATSKEPIPDALLPRVLDFIREFPVYLQTIVQCARKTEIALWPYLFSIAGKPKDLFLQCMASEELVTAASYLIILQNLEPSFVSKQYATLLLDTALQHCNWELAKDLIRFLKAIDPNEIDSPRSSMVINMKIAPLSQTQNQVNQNADVFNLVLGPIARERSFSTTMLTNTIKDRKEKNFNSLHAVANETFSIVNNSTGSGINSITGFGNSNAHNMNWVVRRKIDRSNSIKDRRETFSIDMILQRNARKLLQNYKLIDLGYMSAYLDFHLVAWLSQESEKATCLEDYVFALIALHNELKIISPIASQATIIECANNSHYDIQLSTMKLQQDKQDNSMNKPQTFSQTSESGYFSLAHIDTPTSISSNGYILQHSHIPAIKEHEEVQYKTILSCGQFHHQRQSIRSSMDHQFIKSLSNSQTSLNNDIHRRYYSLQEDMSTSPLSLGLILSSDCHLRILPEKYAIKIRYLLQLFIEAKCIDYALVLSILLQDIASVGRIINMLIRSESLIACSRIQNALKRVTQWAFENECIYRPLIITLQPHIYLLDQFLQAKSATITSHLSSAIGDGLNNNRILDNDIDSNSNSISNSNSNINMNMNMNMNIGQLSNVNINDCSKHIDNFNNNLIMNTQIKNDINNDWLYEQEQDYLLNNDMKHRQIINHQYNNINNINRIRRLHDINGEKTHSNTKLQQEKQKQKQQWRENNREINLDRNSNSCAIT